MLQAHKMGMVYKEMFNSHHLGYGMTLSILWELFQPEMKFSCAHTGNKSILNVSPVDCDRHF